MPVVSKLPRRRPVTKDSLLHKEIEFPVRKELNEGVKVEPSIISGSCQAGGCEGKVRLHLVFCIWLVMVDGDRLLWVMGPCGALHHFWNILQPLGNLKSKQKRNIHVHFVTYSPFCTSFWSSATSSRVVILTVNTRTLTQDTHAEQNFDSGV